jgi:hypothetical protein
MSRNPVLEKLRERLASLEETQRRFARTIPIADDVDRWMPHGGLPAGCIHEVKGVTLASALAFSAILSARLAQNQDNRNQGNIVYIYIAADRSLHPLGLLPYGIRQRSDGFSPGPLRFGANRRTHNTMESFTERRETGAKIR